MFISILYTLGFLGPVTNIDSSIDNCSTIDITWTAPTVDDRVSILYYILRIYDAINGSLVNTVAVDGTSYQFVDNDLFIHRYTYVITGVNELGEGISNNVMFSYQKGISNNNIPQFHCLYIVPRSANENTVSIDHTFTQNAFTIVIQFSISVRKNYRVIIISSPYKVMLECTGQAPNGASVAVHCNDTGSIFSSSYLIEYAKQPNNITGLISVPQYQQCNISIVFSNEAGSSKPFILAFGK